MDNEMRDLFRTLAEEIEKEKVRVRNFSMKGTKCDGYDLLNLTLEYVVDTNSSERKN